MTVKPMKPTNPKANSVRGTILKDSMDLTMDTMDIMDIMDIVDITMDLTMDLITVLTMDLITVLTHLSLDLTLGVLGSLAILLTLKGLLVDPMTLLRAKIT